MSDIYFRLRLRNPTKHWWKSLYLLLSVGMLISNSIVLYLTFLLAFFNPSKSILISMNRFNEASFEFFLIPFVIVSGVIVLIWLFKVLCKEKVVVVEQKTR